MILGIDVGLDGACVLIDSEGSIVSKTVMPTIKTAKKRILDLSALYQWIRSEDEAHKIKHCYIEKVHAMPGNGAVSMYNFGYTAGVTEMCIAALGIPYTMVTPLEWTKKMHLGLSKDIGPKERSLIVFKRKYPGVSFVLTERSTKHHTGLVDALLIAEHGRGLL